MRVAVVGAGVSGLGATWLLNEHSQHEVHVYEADSRAGGHANTVQFPAHGSDEADTTPVDTGFIVLNPSSYPNFLRFLKREGIDVVPTEMTFSVSRDQGKLEWAGGNLFTFFCQPTRVFDPRAWRLFYDILRFNACARRLIDGPNVDVKLSIGEYLQRERYSDAFRDDYLIPMTAAVWSTSPDKCSLGFPACTLIRFMHNHHLLQLTGKPSWLTIAGGSRVYVDRIMLKVRKDRVHLGSPVHALKVDKPSAREQVLLQTSDGKWETFDHVILACHSDAALSLLQKGGTMLPQEEELLRNFKWNKNEAVLHTDMRLMPRRRLAWSCWNYLTSSAKDDRGNVKANVDKISLTYWMNDLQHIPQKQYGNVFVTLNSPFEPFENSVIGRWKYEHPVLNTEAIEAQAQMHTIQNTRGISYAGAYLKYGFHEDGFTSGMRAAVEHLGVVPPFPIRDPDIELKTIWAGYVFDFLEGSGVSRIFGTVFGLILLPLRMVMVSLGFLQ